MKIISIDGCDYSGKSYLVEMLKEEAINRGWDVCVQAFPSKTESGLAARKALADQESESLIAHLMCNDFSLFSKEVMENDASDNTLYIIDRYHITTYSHQRHAIDLSYGQYLLPNLQILLTLKYDDMLVRRKERGGNDWDDSETSKYLSPLGWSALNNAYLDGLNHYSQYYNSIIIADGCDDKDTIVEDAMTKLGIIPTKIAN